MRVQMGTAGVAISFISDVQRGRRQFMREELQTAEDCVAGRESARNICHVARASGVVVLHQVLLRLAFARRQGAAAVQLLAYQVEPVDAGLKVGGKTLEQRSLPRILKQVEGGDD
jgi:hypothetical protein